jgi:hypothetical protein
MDSMGHKVAGRSMAGGMNSSRLQSGALLGARACSRATGDKAYATYIPAEPRFSEQSKRLFPAFADDHAPVITLALDVQHLMPISRGAIGHVSSPLIIKQHLKDLACL